MKITRLSAAILLLLLGTGIASACDRFYVIVFAYEACRNNAKDAHTFATFVKQEGGWMRLPRYLRSKFSGTPEQWADKAVVDMVASMEQAASATATHVEGQPALGGAPVVATARP